MGASYPAERERGLTNPVAQPLSGYGRDTKPDQQKDRRAGPSLPCPDPHLGGREIRNHT